MPEYLEGLKSDCSHGSLMNTIKNHVYSVLSKDDFSIGDSRSKKRYKLAPYKRELELLTGLRPKICIKDYGLREFSKRFHKVESISLREQMTTCNYDSEIMINLQICNYCSKRRVCSQVNSSVNLEEIQLFVQDGFEKCRICKNNFSKILKFLEERRHMFSRENIDINHLFSNPVDIFKPGYGLISSGNYLLQDFMTLSNSVQNAHRNGSITRFEFSSLFYSEMLDRNLTIFESIYLNLCTYVGKMSFAENIKDEFSRREIPTINEFVEFVQDHFQASLRGKNLSIDENFYTSVKTIKDMINQSNDEDFWFFKRYFEQTEKFFSTGLLDNDLEVFFDRFSSDEFDTLFTEFWIEIIKKLTFKMSMENFSQQFGNKKAFGRVLDCVLFIPPSQSEVTIPCYLRVIGIFTIPDIYNPIVLREINQKDEVLPKTSSSYRFSIFDDGLRKEQRNIISFPFLLTSRYEVEIWDGINNYSSKTVGIKDRLMIMTGYQIFSALAAGYLSKKLVNSFGGSESGKIIADFINYFEKTLIGEVRSENIQNSVKALIEEISSPLYKKINPYESLLEISKRDIRDNVLSHSGIIKENEHTGIIDVERFSISVQEGQNNEVLDTQLRLIRKSGIDKNGNHIPIQSSSWKVEKSNSISRYRNKMAEKLCDCLNKCSSIIAGLDSKIKPIYISERLLSKFLDDSLKNELANIVVDIMNSVGTRGVPVLFCALEYSNYSSFIPLERCSVYSLGTESIYCYSQVQNIGDFSTNFVHVGSF